MLNEKDSVLCSLINAIQDNKDQSVSLTLTISGMLISGKMISRDEFFGVSLMKHINELSKDEPIEKYIHMKDTKFYYPGNSSELPRFGGKWRGLLSHVDGFMLGEYESSE